MSKDIRKELAKKYAERKADKGFKERKELRVQILGVMKQKTDQDTKKTPSTDPEDPYKSALEKMREKRAKKSKDKTTEDKTDDKKKTPEQLTELEASLKKSREELTPQKKSSNEKFDKLCEKHKIPPSNRAVLLQMITNTGTKDNLEQTFEDTIGKNPMITKSLDHPGLVKGDDTVVAKKVDFSGMSLDDRQKVLTEKLKSGDY